MNRLRLHQITKHFPGVVALDGVDFELKNGEVHALCGENGAGKSPLMNILSGNHTPDGGHIELHGERIGIPDPQEARRLGIGIVYQERSLVGELSVAENIFAGKPPANRWGMIRFGQLFAQTRQLLDQLGMTEIDPQTRLEALSPAKQQMVEIAKALSQDPEILILDEPTAAISEADAQILFRIIRGLRARGVSVIYISHRMAEIFEIANRVSVLKDGKYQGTRQVAETSVEEIIRMMVGRDLVMQAYASQVRAETVLEVQGFSGPRFTDISLEIKAGEILGLAGLVGAGRTELARAIFGADAKYAGRLIFRGKEIHIHHPAEAMQQGIGYLPENRKEQGLFLEMSVEENIVATDLGATVRGKLIRQGQMTEVARHYIAQLDIRTPSPRQKTIHLSGGNQQKVVIAKWLLRNPALLIVDEPTHGVDVGAKAEIYALLRQLTAAGTAILLISSELPELLSLSDRILVLHNGRLAAALERSQFSEEEIMHYASGTKHMYP